MSIYESLSLANYADMYARGAIFIPHPFLIELTAASVFAPASLFTKP